MRQLVKEGWMHHLGRQLVACFFTKGKLYQSWEEGRNIFDKYLIDADWSINNANWMWLSASFEITESAKIYCPINFYKKYDPDGSYIRKYVPELKDFPKEYIYSPWKAPLSVQIKAKCVIGTHYPSPIVEHQRKKRKSLPTGKFDSKRKSKLNKLGKRRCSLKSDIRDFDFEGKQIQYRSRNEEQNPVKKMLKRVHLMSKWIKPVEEVDEENLVKSERSILIGKRDGPSSNSKNESSTSFPSDSVRKSNLQ